MPNSKISVQWFWIPAAVFLIGIVSIILLLWVSRIHESRRIHFLIEDAIMDAQIKTATCHLWLEEAVSGDSTADEAMDDVNEAISLVTAVLYGGKSEHGLIPGPVLHSQLRSQAESIRSMLMEFKTLGRERLKNPQASGVGSALDQQYDTVFKEILAKAAAFEDLIEKINAAEQVKSGRLLAGILSAWAFIVVAATTGLWNHEKRRKSAEKALLGANDRLLAQTEELTSHRERLEEMVNLRTSELSSANSRLLVEVDERKHIEERVRKLNEELEVRVKDMTARLEAANREMEALRGKGPGV